MRDETLIPRAQDPSYANGPITAQCGDELEAKLQLADTPLEQRPDFPTCSFDANDWAKAFVAQYPEFDLEIARAWFASALMTGYDRRGAQSREQDVDLLYGAAREIRQQRERLLIADAKVGTMEMLAGLGRDQSVRNHAGVMGVTNWKPWQIDEALEKRAAEIAGPATLPTEHTGKAPY